MFVSTEKYGQRVLISNYISFDTALSHSLYHVRCVNGRPEIHRCFSLVVLFYLSTHLVVELCFRFHCNCFNTAIKAHRESNWSTIKWFKWHDIISSQTLLVLRQSYEIRLHWHLVLQNKKKKIVNLSNFP